MKKKWLFLPLLVNSALITSCGNSSTESTTSTTTGKPSSEFLENSKPHSIAYATQTVKSRNSYDSNVIAKILEDNALRYHYTMPGWPNFESYEGREIFSAPKTAGNFFGINKVEIEEVKYTPGQITSKIVKRWNDLNVELGFVESNPDSLTNNINDNYFYDAIKNEEYKNKLVLMGYQTKGTHLKDGKVNENQLWSKFKNVATFEFSEILTAYNTGYQTQANFGLKIKEKDGKLTKEKLSVGYVVASVKKDDRLTNIKNVRKANAFRQGVLDAIKEQGTGEAKFVSKEEVSDDEDAKKLFWAVGDIKRFTDIVRTNKKYLDQDHSIFYLAGASGRENSMAADSLILSGTTNLNGHKMVVERGYDSNGVFEGLGKEKGTNLRAGSANNFHVRGRIRMNGRFYSTKYEIDGGWETAENSAKGLITEAVIESLYGANQGSIDYFGKHNMFGSLATIDPTDLKEGRGIPTGQKINKKFADEIKLHLLKKTKQEKEFEDNFLGSGY